MRPTLHLLSLLTLVLGGCGPSEFSGRVSHVPDEPFECRWSSGPIEIDAIADEAAWQQAQLIDHFYLPWLGAKARPAKTATRARLLWDRQYLYFFAVLEDADLFADVQEHDGFTWHNDVFEMFIKPAADKPGYYEFQVNAAGTQLDMYIPRPPDENFFERTRSADPFYLESEVVHRGTLNVREDQDEGWSVEGRIPWTDFVRTGGRPAVGEAWRFALCRYDYTVNIEEPELSTCAPLQERSFHRHQDYATIKFVGEEDALLDQIPAPVPWTTSRVIGSPEPPAPFRVVKAFPNLDLELPICLRFVPRSDQMLIVDEPRPYQPARLLQANTNPDVDSYHLLIDYEPINGVAYDITFHPEFSENGFVFIGSICEDADGIYRSRITRYTMQTSLPYRFDVDSAQVIIKWPSDGHNGAAIVFGNDGLLYITTGDGTSDSDEDIVGQRMDVLHSKVLRIDVDRPDEGRAYAIPEDNPFIEMPDARPETWAYGLRNPWRIAVDRQTGHIWVGNNGQDLWESVYLIQRGANYGWSLYEGSHPFYPNRERGPTPISASTVDHHHAEARSLTGGIVYYGADFPELVGAYIYGDYETGKIWAVKHDGEEIVWHRELADTTMRITCFAEDEHGELLITDQQSKDEGGVYRLQRNPIPDNDIPFPQWLSETGLFASTAEHQMQPGVIGYSVNAPAWHDGALATRYLAMPAEQQPDGSWRIPTFDFHPSSSWQFPDGTVLVQSLALEMEPGNPASRRWVETRLMTLQNTEWEGYSYIWNEDQTDAQLVDKMGTTVQLAVGKGEDSRQRMWHVPSRSECEACHSRAFGFVLGMTARQLNRPHNYDGQVMNQLRYFEKNQLLIEDWSAPTEAHWRAHVEQELKEANLLDMEDDRIYHKQIKSRLDAITFGEGQRQPPAAHMLAKSPAAYPRLTDPHDATATLNERARSYLHINCASCHIPSGGGNARMNLSVIGSNEDLKALGEKPLHGDFGLTDAQLIAPGSPHRSVVNYRMSTIAGGRMPRVGSHQVDIQGARLLRDWITSLEPAALNDDPIQQSITRLVAADAEDAEAMADELLGSTSGALAVMDAIDEDQVSPGIKETIQQKALNHPLQTVQRLFERYLPEAQRKQRLGADINAEEILTLTGDASRGQQLFMEDEALACLSCHQYNNRGHQVGPDLTAMRRTDTGKSYSPAEILENLLDPSLKIDDKYAAYTLFTVDGKVHTGLITERTDEFIVVKQAGGQTVTIKAEEIDELTRQPKSIMPDHLLKDLSAREAADLLAFLDGLQDG